MKLTILIEDQYVSEAREKAETIFKGISTLKVPVSSTGKEPATHWICSLDVSEEGYNQLVNLKKHSIMSKCSASVLLEEMELKIIK
jgi:hypothetical protein